MPSSVARVALAVVLLLMRVAVWRHWRREQQSKRGIIQARKAAKRRLDADRAIARPRTRPGASVPQPLLLLPWAKRSALLCLPAAPQLLCPPFLHPRLRLRQRWRT